jgi:hypothetical protein
VLLPCSPRSLVVGSQSEHHPSSAVIVRRSTCLHTDRLSADGGSNCLSVCRRYCHQGHRVVAIVPREMLGGVELKLVHRIKLTVNQSCFPDDAPCSTGDCQRSRVFGEAPTIVDFLVFAAFAFFHSECLFNFVEATASPQPRVARFVMLLIVCFNYGDSDIQIESMDVNLERIKAAFDLQVSPCLN